MMHVGASSLLPRLLFIRRDCDVAAIDRNLKLAKRFELKGTPGIYLASGQQVGGYVPAEELESALASAR